MKITPEDGGRRLLVLAAGASAVGGFVLANVSAIAGVAGALLALGFLAGAMIVTRRNAANG